MWEATATEAAAAVPNVSAGARYVFQNRSPDERVFVFTGAAAPTDQRAAPAIELPPGASTGPIRVADLSWSVFVWATGRARVTYYQWD